MNSAFFFIEFFKKYKFDSIFTNYKYKKFKNTFYNYILS